MLEQVKFGTFDLSPAVLEAIDAGKMMFAIDQQQYLQGYLPIQLLRLNELYGEALGAHRPARSTVQVAGLPKGALVEIDLVAVKPGG